MHGGRKQGAKVVEVVMTFLKWIEEVNPIINAICTLSETILEEARAIDERIAWR